MPHGLDDALSAAAKREADAIEYYRYRIRTTSGRSTSVFRTHLFGFMNSPAPTLAASDPATGCR